MDPTRSLSTRTNDAVGGGIDDGDDDSIPREATAPPAAPPAAETTPVTELRLPLPAAADAVEGLQTIIAMGERDYGSLTKILTRKKRLNE